MEGPRLGRRAFLGALGGGALAVLSPLGSGGGGLLSFGGGTAAARAAVPFKEPLRFPPVHTGEEILIPIREAAQQILPGERTRLWTYGGSFPGPTIRRPAGQRTQVTYHHKLPANVGDLTVHFHGGHNGTDFDGQPGGLTANQPVSLYCHISRSLSPRESGNDLLIPPGGRKTYDYALVEDGHPVRAAFKWYHDHRLDRTAEHSWRGLAGMWILDDDFEDALPLPKGDRDLPLMIADRTFDSHNQLTDPFTNLRPPADGISGASILVNGTFMPHHHVSARRYRLRLLNVSQFRSYAIHLSTGAPMVQIGTDSGLMPAPVPRREILLGPAERAEVIVDFAHARGERVELRSTHRHAGPNPEGAHTYDGALMQFRVGHDLLPDATRVPRKLRPLPPWTRRVSHKPDFRWEITIGGTFNPSWLINGRSFDPSHSEVFPRLGSTQTWEIRNRTAVAHVMHLHHTDWYLLAREGKQPPPWENCLKDTFFVFPGERILLAGHFSDYIGKFILHCHMLDHEDHGLMSQFTVVQS